MRQCLMTMAELAAPDCFALRQGDIFVPSNHPITYEIIDKHLTGQSAAIYLLEDGKSRLAVLDFDNHGNDLSPLAVRRMAWRVSQEASHFGLYALPVRSSGGAGIHLWFRWEQPQDAGTIRATLTQVLESQGFAEGSKGTLAGQVEIFPKQTTGRGSHITLPFSRRSCPLNNILEPAETPIIWPSSANLAPPTSVPTITEPTSVDSLPGALAYVDADDYATWVRVGLALKADLPSDGFQFWDDWSKRSVKYPGSGKLRQSWERMKPRGSLSVATIYYLAVQRGWKPPRPKTNPYRALYAKGAAGEDRGRAAERMAGYFLRSRIDTMMVLDVMAVWNVARLQPPLTTEELEQRVDNAAQRLRTKILGRP